MKYVLALSLGITLLFPSLVFAKECKTDKGRLSDPFAFGSPEQLKLIQKEISRGCDLIGIKYQPNGTTVKFIAVDMNKQKMTRITNNSISLKYEGWHSFSKAQILNDDPSDGFDLPNYKTSKSPMTSFWSDSFLPLINKMK